MNRLFEFGRYWNSASFLFYIFIGVCVCVCCQKGARLNSRCGRENALNKFYFLAFLSMFLPFAFRDKTVGTDTVEYIKMFDNMTHLSIDWKEIMIPHQEEPLFQLLLYLLRIITNDYRILFFVSGIIICSAYIVFIIHFWSEEDIFIPLIAICVPYTYSMSAMRSSIAVAFVLLSLCCLKTGKRKWALLLCLAAYWFHYTTIVNIALVILYRLIVVRGVVSKRKLYFHVILLAVAFFASIRVLVIYLASSRYRYYLGAGGSLIGNWAIIFELFLAIVLLKKRSVTDSKGGICIVCAFYTSLLLIPSLLMGAYRLTSYYEMPMLYVWSMYAKLFYRKSSVENRFLKSGIILLFVLFYCLFVMSRRSASIGFPYSLFRSY